MVQFGFCSALHGVNPNLKKKNHTKIRWYKLRYIIIILLFKSLVETICGPFFLLLSSHFFRLSNLPLSTFSSDCLQIILLLFCFFWSLMSALIFCHFRIYIHLFHIFQDIIFLVCDGNTVSLVFILMYRV